MKLKSVYEFQIVAVARIKMAVFCVVAPCSPIEVYRRFGGVYCLHDQGDELFIVICMVHLSFTVLYCSFRVTVLSIN
jgi:hypothetical protein